MHYDLGACWIDPVQLFLAFVPIPVLFYLWRRHQRYRERVRSEKMAPEWVEVYKKNVLSVDNMHEFDSHGRNKKQHGRLPPAPRTPSAFEVPAPTPPDPAHVQNPKGKKDLGKGGPGK